MIRFAAFAGWTRVWRYTAPPHTYTLFLSLPPTNGTNHDLGDLLECHSLSSMTRSAS